MQVLELAADKQQFKPDAQGPVTRQYPVFVAERETAVSVSPSYDDVRHLVESAPAPRRPNRSRPIHLLSDEIGAWESASDEAWDMID